MRLFTVNMTVVLNNSNKMLVSYAFRIGIE
ncbi:hypothetical protein FV769_22070 [Vibrio parahaemolyticus]|nr:hypothetical protein [Vibrio parahaemolyticus]EGQ9980935.1 hypothetical protein [Vibrio parahaemolyticus]TBT45108.1 hypothetical protein D5E79_06000 [Vibrio parahaemolyticus]TOZ97781.1 hypothetical protein DXE04_08410 [Vibrio parahaemolyticus]